MITIVDTPNTVKFELIERIDTFRKGGKEWALTCLIEPDHRWTLCAWGTKPTQVTVAFAKELVLRSFEFYHKHLRLIPFNVKESFE